MNIYRWIRNTFIIVALVALIVLANLYLNEPIRLQYGEWQASPSLLVAIAIIIMAIVAMLVLFKILSVMLFFPSYLSKWRSERDIKHQQRLVVSGLHALVLGDNKQTYKSFSALSKYSDGACAWLAATAAENLENPANRNLCLKRATESGNANIAAAAAAQIAVNEGNISEAARLLSDAGAPNSSPLLAAMYLSLTTQQQQWTKALATAYRLYEIAPVQKSQQTIDDTVTCALQKITDIHALKNLWNNDIHANERKKPPLLTAYLYALRRLGDDAAATAELEKSFKTINKTPDTLFLIADLGGEAMCEKVFTLAQKDPPADNAEYYSAMATLAERLNLTGKARRYYQMANSLNPRASYAHSLANLENKSPASNDND